MYTKEVRVVDVNFSSEALSVEEYSNARAEMWFGVAEWMKSGGGIPEDAKLEAELVAPVYLFDNKARRKIEPKDDVKARLGRSPDRGDALALAVYKGSTTRIVAPTPKKPAYRLASGGRGF